MIFKVFMIFSLKISGIVWRENVLSEYRVRVRPSLSSGIVCQKALYKTLVSEIVSEMYVKAFLWFFWVFLSNFVKIFWF